MVQVHLWRKWSTGKSGDEGGQFMFSSGAS